MANFDTASKKTAEISPKGFVHLCFGFETSNIIDAELIQPEQPTVDMRQADVVIKAEIGGKQVIVHFETYGLEVYSNVIYLRPDAGRSDPGRFVQDIAGHEVLTRYKVFRLIEMHGQSILEAKPMGASALYTFNETSYGRKCRSMVAALCTDSRERKCREQNRLS